MKKFVFRHWILQVGLLSLLVFASCGKDVEQVPAEPADLETRAPAVRIDIPIPNVSSMKLQNESNWYNSSPRYVSMASTASIDVRMNGNPTVNELVADFDNNLRLLGNYYNEDLTSWIDLIYLEEVDFRFTSNTPPYYYYEPGYRYHVEFWTTPMGEQREVRIGNLTFVIQP